MPAKSRKSAPEKRKTRAQALRENRITFAPSWFSVVVPWQIAGTNGQERNLFEPPACHALPLSRGRKHAGTTRCNSFASGDFPQYSAVDHLAASNLFILAANTRHRLPIAFSRTLGMNIPRVLDVSDVSFRVAVFQPGLHPPQFHPRGKSFHGSDRRWRGPSNRSSTRPVTSAMRMAAGGNWPRSMGQTAEGNGNQIALPGKANLLEYNGLMRDQSRVWVTRLLDEYPAAMSEGAPKE
jgi:hypothetical protein